MRLGEQALTPLSGHIRGELLEACRSGQIQVVLTVLSYGGRREAVEMFCLDWAPRKIAADVEAFTLLPDVLAAWIRFVGRRRCIPDESITVGVQAAYDYAPEMIELSEDPETWGPAKTMSLAIQQRGIDITDQAALDEFTAEVNRNGGIDVLAQSLADSAGLRR
jgi:hypothetical protein